MRARNFPLAAVEIAPRSAGGAAMKWTSWYPDSRASNTWPSSPASADATDPTTSRKANGRTGVLIEGVPPWVEVPRKRTGRLAGSRLARTTLGMRGFPYFTNARGRGLRGYKRDDPGREGLMSDRAELLREADHAFGELREAIGGLSAGQM